MDRYDKKFQKYILGEALKGNKTMMEDFEEGILVSDAKMIKFLDKNDCFIIVPKTKALSYLFYSRDKLIKLSNKYIYTFVKDIKESCLKIDKNWCCSSKYLQFFDLDNSDLYFNNKGVLYIMEDDLLSGCIMCIKGGQNDE